LTVSLARPPADLLDVLRTPAFQQYTISRIGSGVGTSLLQAVILWQVYALSGSALDLGLVGVVGFVSALFSSAVGGVVVDTYDRRAILLGAQALAGLSSLGMLVALGSQHVSIGLVYGVVLLTGVASSFDYPARQAVLPAIVSRRLLGRALTTNSAVSSLTSVTGPALGGVLIALGGVGWAYAAHLALTGTSMLMLLPLRLPNARGGSSGLSRAALWEGLSFVRQRPALLGAMTLDMFAVLFGGARALLPIYAVDVLHTNALGYGVLSASLEAGTLLMALVLLVLPVATRIGPLLLGTVAVFGLATVVFGVSTWLPLSIAAYAAVGMADQVSMVLRQNLIQLSTPDALRGRVTAVNSVFVSASNEIGAMESGLVAAVTGAVFAVVSGGIACLLVVALVAWRIPALRRSQLP